MPAIDFKTKLFKVGSVTIAKLPNAASAKLPSRGQVMVKGTIDGYQFQTALEPDGRGSHWLNVSPAMQTAISAHAGDSVSLSIEATKDWIEPEVPKDWQKALDANPRVKALWQDVTPLARWEWLRWIASTNNPATRQKHIEVSCSKLLNGLRRPCCFNRNMCCVPEVSKGGRLLEPTTV